jgi:hypothetical protein
MPSPGNTAIFIEQIPQEIKKNRSSPERPGEVSDAQA